MGLDELTLDPHAGLHCFLVDCIEAMHIKNVWYCEQGSIKQAKAQSNFVLFIVSVVQIIADVFGNLH